MKDGLENVYDVAARHKTKSISFLKSGGLYDSIRKYAESLGSEEKKYIVDVRGIEEVDGYLLATVLNLYKLNKEKVFSMGIRGKRKTLKKFLNTILVNNTFREVDDFKNLERKFA